MAVLKNDTFQTVLTVAPFFAQPSVLFIFVLYKSYKKKKKKEKWVIVALAADDVLRTPSCFKEVSLQGKYLTAISCTLDEKAT